MAEPSGAGFLRAFVGQNDGTRDGFVEREGEFLAGDFETAADAGDVIAAADVRVVEEEGGDVVEAIGDVVE